MLPEETKRCTKCSVDKPLGDFYEGRAVCKLCHNKRTHDYYVNNKEACAEARTTWRESFRDKVRAIYGNACFCCGETRKEFLALDHVNGGGGQHRKTVSADALYRQIALAGVADPNYRLACHNCNMSLGLYGYCPHQEQQEKAA